MAKDKNQNQTETETEATTPATEAEATATANTSADTVDERYRMIKHPETGEMVKRIDYIRHLWTDKKMSRGNIAKHLTQLTGKKVLYQIVFSATRGLPGGPPKSEDGSTPGEATASGSEAAGGETV